jgi:hypothetical protein
VLAADDGGVPSEPPHPPHSPEPAGTGPRSDPLPAEEAFLYRLAAVKHDIVPTIDGLLETDFRPDVFNVMKKSLHQLRTMLRSDYLPMAPQARTVILEELADALAGGIIAANRLETRAMNISDHRECCKYLEDLLASMNTVLAAYRPYDR